jgi:hypothetical protein
MRSIRKKGRSVSLSDEIFTLAPQVLEFRPAARFRPRATYTVSQIMVTASGKRPMRVNLRDGW